jgi:hypothetical protein
MRPLLPEKADVDGVRNKWYRVKRLQSRLSGFFYGANIPRPSDAEIEAAQHHAGHDAALDVPLHAYEDADRIEAFHGGVLHHPGMPLTNAEQSSTRAQEH